MSKPPRYSVGRVGSRALPFASVLVLLSAFGILGVPTPASAQEGSSAREDVSIRGAALSAPVDVADRLDPFRADPDSAAVAGILSKRAASGFPATPEDHVLLARLWRRADRPGLALAALDAAVAGGRGADAGVRALLRLERARVLFEADREFLGADPDRVVGSRAWWTACEAMDERVLKEIRWDLLAVSTPEEREAWAELTAGPEACEWFRAFWDERARRMAISTNERLALHYRRLAYARDWYWIPRERFLVGTADWHGRPEGLPMDDRGFVFVRMGHPLTHEGFSATGAGEPGVTAAADLASDVGIPDEGIVGGPKDEFDRAVGAERSYCWPYYRPDGYRIFCFAQHPQRADGDFRLVDLVEGAQGTGFFQRYVANSNLWSAGRRARRLDPGGGLRDDWERALDGAQRGLSGRQAQLRMRESVDDALRKIPDVPDVYPTAALRVETLRFLNPGWSEWQVWTLASARAGDLAPAVGPAGPNTLAVSGRFAVGGGEDADGLEIRELGPVLVAAEAVAPDDGILLSSVFRAGPGEHPVTVVVLDAHRPNGGNWYQGTVNVPAIGGLPQLSDIAIAQAEGGTWTRDGRTFLRVTPSHVTNADGTIHTYFEVYGVRPGTRYEVEFRLAPNDAAERIWRLAPDDLAFRLQFASEMPGEIGRHHLELDLSATEPGEYVLAVRIQDEDTQAYSLPSVTGLSVVER